MHLQALNNRLGCNMVESKVIESLRALVRIYTTLGLVELNKMVFADLYLLSSHDDI